MDLFWCEKSLVSVKGVISQATTIYVHVDCNIKTLIKDLHLMQKAEAKVTSNYKAFMHISVHGCPSLEDLMHGFKDWKVGKDCIIIQGSAV